LADDNVLIRLIEFDARGVHPTLIKKNKQEEYSSRDKQDNSQRDEEWRNNACTIIKNVFFIILLSIYLHTQTAAYRSQAFHYRYRWILPGISVKKKEMCMSAFIFQVVRTETNLALRLDWLNFNTFQSTVLLHILFTTRHQW
jgi:hypothetical protein